MGCSLKLIAISLILLNITMLAGSLYYVLNSFYFYWYLTDDKSTSLVFGAFQAVLFTFFAFKSIFECIGYLNHS